MSIYAPTAFSTEIVARLRGLMARYDVNQADLAFLCDVSQSQFSKIIRGARPITVDQLAAICDALEVDLADLVTEVQEFLAHRDRTSPSPVRLVDNGTRLDEPEQRLLPALDPWARASSARIVSLNVGDSIQNRLKHAARAADPEADHTDEQ